MSTSTKMKAFSEKCTGCLMCQLACSFVKTQAFSPANSFITVERVDKSETYDVGFTEDCDACGVCAQYCYYDAIEAAL
jgi:ferredoxin